MIKKIVLNRIKACQQWCGLRPRSYDQTGLRPVKSGLGLGLGLKNLVSATSGTYCLRL